MVFSDSEWVMPFCLTLEGLRVSQMMFLMVARSLLTARLLVPAISTISVACQVQDPWALPVILASNISPILMLERGLELSDSS
jgi:hypothetical protein